VNVDIPSEYLKLEAVNTSFFLHYSSNTQKFEELCCYNNRIEYDIITDSKLLSYYTPSSEEEWNAAIDKYVTTLQALKR
jgi:hypothetical protein